MRPVFPPRPTVSPVLLPRPVLLPLLVLLVSLLGVPGEAAAQVPDTFTNLQLLPKEIEKGELIGVMRSWATALGVRCNHCHVGPDNLEGMDFASDDKASKRSARAMLQMARAINREHLAALPASEAERRAVSCFTCHRGQTKPPRRLLSLLTETASTSGVDAAIERFRELRDLHGEDGTYDFSPRTLVSLARSVGRQGEPEDSLRILRANTEFHPESASARAALGVGLMISGDAGAARRALEDALRLDPEDPTAVRAMERLRATESETEPER